MTRGHILFVPSSYPRTGAPTEGIFYQDQARALQRAGWQVGVVFPEFLRWREGQLFPAGGFRRMRVELVEEEGVTLLRTRIWNPPLRWLRAARWSAVAERMIERYIERNGRPDVIHAQGFLWGGLVAAQVGARLGIPVAVTEHSSRFPRGLVKGWEGQRIAVAVPSVGAVIAVSEALAQALRPFVGDRTIEVIPNLVDVEFFTPALGVPSASRPMTFLAIASLDWNKGIDVLLRSFAALPPPLRASRLQIVGAGPGRRSFERLAVELGVAERVAFLGWRDRMGVRDALRAADVFVLASRVETFGVAAIEAMACGIPVVATLSGGPDDFVAPPFGWTVPPGHPVPLAAAMAEAARASAGFDHAGARRRAVERFGEAVIGARLGGVYQRLRDGGRRGFV